MYDYKIYPGDINMRKYVMELTIVGFIIWITGIVLCVVSNNPYVDFSGLILFGIGTYAPGVTIWYVIKKEWSIATRAILLGIGLGLYASIVGMLGMIYFRQYWLVSALVFDIIGILSVPVRGAMLEGYDW